MSSEPGDRLQELFLAATEMSKDQREAWLSEQCGSDHKLLRDVLSLLEHDVSGADLLDEAMKGVRVDADQVRRQLGIHGNVEIGDTESVQAGSKKSPKRKSLDLVGKAVGPYKLLQRIGEGGMGTVYMAEQEQPVRRRVALKIIKPGLDTKQVIARFEAERQALAMMDHHHIAKVLDAGATDDGHPYFAMELVKGIPITKYCDDHKLALKERLALFIPVCHAIQHAHQKGIIHRDIKPSNVLVAMHDGVPVPKVIDFGVAKATHQRLTEKTMFTALGQVVGTLEYMSPEQAEMNQLDIDTRSDVYSLGVMLYELLTGTTPITADQLRKSGFSQMLKTIREYEPPKPSTRLSESGETLPAISSQRKTEPSRLSRLLRGDLDWIVMKSLEKDRTRRYETANGLAADVRRYLNADPVEAGPPSASYRLRKLAKKHKPLLATAAAISTVLLLATGISVWFAFSERNAVRNLEAEQGKTKTALASAVRAEGRATRNEQAMMSERDRAIAAEKQAESESAERQKTIAALKDFLYVADLQTAAREIQQGHLDVAQRLLNEYVPEPGDRDRRCFTWHLLMNRAAIYQGTLSNTFGNGTEMVLSPDGNLLLEAERCNIRLLDMQTQQQLWSHCIKTREITDIRFSADGKHFALARAYGPSNGFQSAHYSMRGVDVRSADDPMENSWSPPEDAGVGRCVDFHPSKPLIACGAGMHVAVWNYRTGKRVLETADHQWDIDCVRFVKGGAKLVAASYGDTVRIYDAATGELDEELIQHPAPSPVTDPRSKSTWWLVNPVSIEFSPDGRLMAVASNGPLIHLWDVESRERVGTLSGHLGNVSALAFSLDGKYLFSGGTDYTVRQWDVASKAEVRSLPGQPYSVKSLAVDRNGKQLYIQTASIQRLNIAPPDQAEVVDISSEGGVLNIVALSPDGSLVASADVNGKTRVHRTDSGERVFEIDTPNSSILEFTPDNRSLLVSWAGAPDVSVWDVQTGELIRRIPVEGTVYATSVTPDSKRVAISTHQFVSIFELDTGEQVETLRGNHLRYTPDGKLYAIWSNEGVAMYQTEDHRKLYVINDSWARRIRTANDGLVISSDSRYAALISGDNQIVVWEAATGRPVQTLGGQLTAITAIAFCGDGKTIASSGNDQRVILWDLVTGKPKCALSDHQAQVNGIAFCPTNNLLASAGEDNRIRLIRVDQNAESVRMRQIDSVASASNFRTKAELGIENLAVSRGQHSLGRPAPPRTTTAQTALRFDGSRRMRLPEIDADPTNGITLEAWVRVDGLSHNAKFSDQMIYALNGLEWQKHVYLEVHSDFHWRAHAHKVEGSWLKIDAEIERSTSLNHVALVLNHDQFQFFVDGKLVDSRDASSLSFEKNWLLFLGGTQTDPKFIGILDEFHFSDIARYAEDFQPKREFEPDVHTLALYHFDRDDEGIAYDASAHHNHIVMLNPAWVELQPEATTADLAANFRAAGNIRSTKLVEVKARGIFGRPAPPRTAAEQTVLACDGTQRLQVSNITLDPELGVTLEAWFRPDGLSGSGGGDASLVAYSGTDSPLTKAMHFHVMSDFSWRVDATDSGSIVTIASPIDRSGRLTHGALVWSGGELKFFLGGRLVETKDASKIQFDETWHLMIGGSQSGAKYVGLVDEVRLSNTARYAEDFVPEREFESDEHTKALYHFDANPDGIAYDSSDHHRHGAMTNPKWGRVSKTENTVDLVENFHDADNIQSTSLAQTWAHDVVGKPAPLRIDSPQSFLQFDGTRRQFRIPNIEIEPDNGITMEAWLRPDGLRLGAVYGDTIFSGSSTEGSLMELQVGSQFLWYAYCNFKKKENEILAEFDSSVENRSTLQHVSIVRTRQKFKLFVGGKLVGTRDVSDEPFPRTWKIYVGGLSWGRNFIGLLDEFRFSNTVRYKDDFTPEREFSSDDHTEVLFHFDQNDDGIAYDESDHHRHVLMANPKWAHQGENQRSAADSLRRPRQSMVAGSPLYRPAPKRNQGANTVLSCDGKTSGFRLPKISIDSTEKLTLEAWARPTGLAGNRNGDAILEARFPSGSGFYVRISKTFEWQLAAWTTEGHVDRIGTPIERTTELQHIAAVKDGDELKLVVNGRPVGSIDLSTLDTLGQPIFWIGRAPSGGTFLGLLDEFRISNSSRYDEIFSPQREFESDESTIAIYHFDANRHNIAYDYSGNRHHVPLINPDWRKVTGEVVTAVDTGPEDIEPWQPEPALAMEIPTVDISKLPAADAAPTKQEAPARIEQQSALQFDGQKGTFGLPELLLDPYEGVTVEAWVRATGMSATSKWGDVILIARTGRKRETWFQLKVDEHAKWQLNAYAPSYARGRRLAETIATGAELVHVAATFTTERMNLYVNGKWEGESDISDLRLTDHWNFGIAGYHSGNAVFEGILDELRISREIRYEDDFQPQREFESDDKTVALYHFDANAQNIAFDYSGNHHHAKLRESKFVVIEPGGGATDDSEQHRSSADTVSLALPRENESPITLPLIDVKSLPQVKPLFHYQEAPQREDAIQTAMRCNGNDSNFASPPLTLDLGSGITMEFWIKPEQLSESKWGDQLLLATTGESNSVSLAIKLQRSLNFLAMLSSPEPTENGFARGNKASKLQEPLKDSPWVHVALTIREGTMTMFVGGKPTGSGDVSAHPLSENWIFHIGGHARNQELIGLIDEVRISDTVRYTEPFEPEREFTSDESTSLLYHFDANKNDIIYDDSGKKHHVKKERMEWVDVQNITEVASP